MDQLPQLDPLSKPGTKLTLLIPGGGMMGCDSRTKIVSKGWLDVSSGTKLCYAEPRGRKIFDLVRLLQHGAIVLKGHEESRAVFESQAPAADGMRSFILDGKGGRFYDENGEGPDALIAYIKQHLVLHTLKPDRQFVLLGERAERGAERTVVDAHFHVKLLEGLGPAVELEPAPAEAPARKTLLTEVMLAKLREADGKEPAVPLYKIFSPEGAGTWLLTSIEDDGDTLWAVCDIGAGLVEFGTVSLQHLETARGPRFKMPFERDKFFDGSKLSVRELCRKESLSA